MSKKNRVSFYIDGFNFYYGLRDGGPDWKKYYWINLVTLFAQFLKEEEELVEVNYFTAPPRSKGKRLRQAAFLNVNKSLNPNSLKVWKGNYKQVEKKCTICNRTYKDLEEKETDVNIAVKIIRDITFNEIDKAVIVSADSDLMAPLRFTKEYNEVNSSNKQLMILFPPNQHSRDLEGFDCLSIKMLNYEGRFKKALLQKRITTGAKQYYIPPEWDTYR